MSGKKLISKGPPVPLFPSSKGGLHPTGPKDAPPSERFKNHKKAPGKKRPHQRDPPDRRRRIEEKLKEKGHSQDHQTTKSTEKPTLLIYIGIQH